MRARRHYWYLNERAMKEYLVVFQPVGKRGRIQEGKTLLEAGRELGADLESLCGGRQACGKCKVRIEEGPSLGLGIRSGQTHLSLPTEKEVELLGESAVNDGYRLACAATIAGPLSVYIPEESRTSKQVVAKTATQRAISLKPAVRKCYVELSNPRVEDPRGDWERLSEEITHRFGLAGLDIDYQALCCLSDIVRKADWKVTVTVSMERHRVTMVHPGLVERSFGLAIDVGTTTLAGYLCDLNTGEIIAAEAVMNPQISYGEDVISRITYAMDSPDGLSQLNACVIEALNGLTSNLAGKAGLVVEDIADVTMVGNTAMHHLFLKLDPQHLGRAPFTPVLHRPLDIMARELGLNLHPATNVHILPILAGFVGADNIGVLVSEKPHDQEEVALVVDVGTNGELVLGNRRRLIAASCATGSPFEGAHIKFGMRAAAGAIERVVVDPQTCEVRFKVVGDDCWSDQGSRVKARGICGSGVIDAIAGMLHAQIINPRGAFNKNVSMSRLLRDGGEPEFVIAWPAETAIDRAITISQGDVREVQLAKGALAAGARLLMNKLGVEQVDKVILAGAFGLHIDKANAMSIGLVPDCGWDKVYSVGNAAGEGARMALLNVNERREAAEIAQRLEYIELTAEPSFSKEFVHAMEFRPWKGI